MKGSVACPPTSWGPAPGPGGVVDICSACACTVFLAPSSQALLKAHPQITVVCVPCVDSGRAGKFDGLAMTGAQLAEAAAIDREESN